MDQRAYPPFLEREVFRGTLFSGRHVLWYQSSRRHHIGWGRAWQVMSTCDGMVVAAKEELDERIVWIGLDDRGVELEIVALSLPDALVVIHVMPTALRRRP